VSQKYEPGKSRSLPLSPTRLVKAKARKKHSCSWKITDMSKHSETVVPLKILFRRGQPMTT